MRNHPFFDCHALVNGKLLVDGKHSFLKTGKPLRNFSDEQDIAQLIRDLPVLVSKNYRNLALNCYWHHFNPSGDGNIEVSLEPLRQLIAAIREHGMYASLSVETYGVGGGQIPSGFWEQHPEAVAVNHEGQPVRDTEYGYDTAVPSLFSEAYCQASRAYMTSLVEQLGAENFLYFETTVEPQFMGAQWLDYSTMAANAYAAWCQQQEDDAPAFPKSFPVSQSFREDPVWNRFRAQALAEWINGDARALRAGAGNAPLWIASDYLDAEEETCVRRCGNALELLRGMTEVDIVQINWSWCNIERKPNLRAYERVHQVRRECQPDWVIAEHMTINGTDYFESDMQGLLENTLNQGTQFGWEFVDIAPDRDDPAHPLNYVTPGDFKPQHFGVYDGNWNPKPPLAVVENNWDEWMKRVEECASNTTGIRTNIVESC
ncbi:MAG: hypothetical protein AAF649_10455 [Verrucomicrobiota bacterium]